MRHPALSGLAVLVALALPRPAAALNLTFSFSFGLAFAPESVAFGPDTQDTSGTNPGRLFVSENSSGGLGDNVIHAFDLAGAETRSFNTSSAFDEVRGLDYRDATGTLLISTNERGGGAIPSRVREINLDGSDVAGGIDLVLPPNFEPEATFYHDDRGTFFVADEEGPGEIGIIQEFALDGTPGDGTNGVLFQVSFMTGPYDDPNGMDFLGDFVYVGDDNSGVGFASRLEVFDLNGTSVFTEEWSTLTNLANSDAATVALCQAVTTAKGLNCADFEGMTIDLIDLGLGAGPELHLVGIFEDQQTLVAWKLGDLPAPPSSVPPPPVPEPALAWLVVAAGAALARRLSR